MKSKATITIIEEDNGGLLTFTVNCDPMPTGEPDNWPLAARAAQDMVEASGILPVFDMGPLDKFPKDPEELLKMLKSGLIKLEIPKPDDYQEAKFVLCGTAQPDSFRIPGAVDKPCDGGCGATIIYSPDNPPRLKALCYSCASKAMEDDRQQTIQE